MAGDNRSSARAGSLRADALDLWHVVALGLAFQGLALVVYFNVGVMEVQTGPIVPLVFALVTVAMLPTAVSFAVMNRKRPSAGAGSSWAREALAPPIGVWVGWMSTTLYLLASILMPFMFGLFSNSLLDALGLDTSFATAAAGGLVAVGVIAYLTRHDIRLSARVAALLMLVEVAFVTALAVFIVIDQAIRGRLSWAPFDPTAATHGLDGAKQAALFAVLAVAGYDVIAPVAEETRRARRLIPLATFIMAVAAGTYWVLSSYAFVVSVPQGTMAGYVQSGQFTPIYLVADHYIGVLRILVPLTGMTAVFACYTAGSTAASRLIYSLARNGFGPARLARIDQRTRTPWTAQLLVLSLCAVVPIVLGWWQGTYLAGFAWVAQAMVFFILCLYLLVNVANIAFHRRVARASFNLWWNLIVPVVAIAVDAYILYAGWLDELLLNGGPFRTQTSIAWLSLAWGVVGVVATAWHFRGGVAAIPTSGVISDVEERSAAV